MEKWKSKVGLNVVLASVVALVFVFAAMTVNVLAVDGHEGGVMDSQVTEIDSVFTHDVANLYDEIMHEVRLYDRGTSILIMVIVFACGFTPVLVTDPCSVLDGEMRKLMSFILSGNL